MQLRWFQGWLELSTACHHGHCYSAEKRTRGLMIAIPAVLLRNLDPDERSQRVDMANRIVYIMYIVHYRFVSTVR